MNKVLSIAVWCLGLNSWIFAQVVDYHDYLNKKLLFLVEDRFELFEDILPNWIEGIAEVKYTYDTLGAVIDSSRVELKLDTLGRIIEKKHQFSDSNRVFVRTTYTYDNNIRSIKIDDPYPRYVLDGRYIRSNPRVECVYRRTGALIDSVIVGFNDNLPDVKMIYGYGDREGLSEYLVKSLFYFKGNRLLYRHRIEYVYFYEDQLPRLH